MDHTSSAQACSSFIWHDWDVSNPADGIPRPIILASCSIQHLLVVFCWRTEGRLVAWTKWIRLKVPEEIVRRGWLGVPRLERGGGLEGVERVGDVTDGWLMRLRVVLRQGWLSRWVGWVLLW